MGVGYDHKKYFLKQKKRNLVSTLSMKTLLYILVCKISVRFCLQKSLSLLENQTVSSHTVKCYSK